MSDNGKKEIEGLDIFEQQFEKKANSRWMRSIIIETVCNSKEVNSNIEKICNEKIESFGKDIKIEALTRQMKSWSFWIPVLLSATIGVAGIMSRFIA